MFDYFEDLRIGDFQGIGFWILWRRKKKLFLGIRLVVSVMFYGTVVWDPWLIVGQIVCLQCFYYLTLGVFMTIFVGTRVPRMSLVYFFDYATITTSTVTGCCVIASFLFSSLAGAGYMLYLIERAKKCLDFSATVYVIHLFICIVYGGWPSSMTWWVLHGTGIAVMALLGEYLCIRRELREIPITRYRSTPQQLHDSSTAAKWHLHSSSTTTTTSSTKFLVQ
ncbi:protein SYS1 homolog isoform X2 [Carya illinoinensis]|uniref:protein SYS1 homolog isoform X2 n=1 Tax=Carya illinoinensis TaxID=32201 RepID=UPI001C71AABA|nr:protein SYS1 homolog isoform X2 [Carya illinoinensis]